MQIGEVAKRSSLTVDAIRFYEKRKLLAFWLSARPRHFKP
jgi:DNA-binding transcriptional MerR regulator